MALLITTAILFTGIISFRIYTNKFYNPYTLTLIYGKKGCGKSTIAQKLIYKHYKRGWHIYYNEGDSRFRAGTPVDASKLWTYDYKPHSLIIIDEVNLLWDNRQFKTFPKELAAWFRLQRHYKVKVILFSQTADADKKIRDLTDRVYLCKRHCQVLICCVPYEKEIVYLEPKKEGDVSGFIDRYEKRSFGPIGCMWCWLPKWVKTHDSFQSVQLDGKGNGSSVGSQNLQSKSTKKGGVENVKRDRNSDHGRRSDGDRCGNDRGKADGDRREVRPGGIRKN